MQLSDIFLQLGEENFNNLLRGISIGRLKTYQLFDRVKTRLYLNKLNSEALRKAAPRLWTRMAERDDEFASDIAQAVLISHLDMIQAVLDHQGIPHQDGFFAKDADVAGHLQGGWQQQAWDKFRGVYPPPALLFYINHLDWEIAKSTPGIPTIRMKELFEAVRAGDRARVQTLVDADPSLAVFAAAIMGDAERLEQLVTGNRSLVSALSSDGWTPLHLAAFFGKNDAARLLLNKGASVTARSTNAMSNTPLHAAAAGQHPEIVQLLLDHGADANARQHGGWAPLHSAAQNGDLESARALIAGGADVSARAENNQKPLDLALTKAQQAMVEFLEAVGAKL